MKYLSIVIFASLMYWTWTLSNAEAPVSFETHAGIQEKLSELITNTIKSKKPEVQEIFIEKIWTEILNNNIVKAHFKYRFRLPETNTEGSSTETTIQGESLLERQAIDNETGQEQWKLIEFKTTNNLIVFENPQIITTGPNSNISSSDQMELDKTISEKDISEKNVSEKDMTEKNNPEKKLFETHE